MDIFRFTKIAEAGQPILDPFTVDQLQLLGRLCRLRSDQSILDHGSGKGELLCTWRTTIASEVLASTSSNRTSRRRRDLKYPTVRRRLKSFIAGAIRELQ